MPWTARNSGLDKIISNQWWLPNDAVQVVGAYQAIGMASLADSYVNLANPGSNDLVAGVAPTWSAAAGWQFNGSTQYLISSIIPESDYTIVARFQGEHGITGSIFGQAASNADFRVDMSFLNVGGTVRITYNYRWAAGVSTRNFEQYSEPEDRLIVALAGNTGYYLKQTTFILTAHTPVSSTFSGTPSVIYIGAHNNAGSPASFFSSNVLALAIYAKTLSSNDIRAIATNMQALTNPSLPVYPALAVNYIAQQPGTRHLNSTSHELLIATDGGLFRSYNGGRTWAAVILPDPSNAEFADSPAATVDELTFHWAAYDPVTALTLFALGYKASVNRVWIYKSVDNGDTWTSRGVIAT
jgi:hypothetical protein